MSDHLNYHALPIDNVVVETTRRPIDEAKVLELMASIQEVGLLNAVLIRTNRFLVAGAHRLEACKRLGWTTIPCKFFERSDKLRAELAAIDENLIRNNPGAAEHAVLTERRAQIIEALAAEAESSDEKSPDRVSSQPATKPDRGGRPKEVASVRDQAAKTGASKDKVARSRKRAKTLGTDTLEKVKGTSLDSGVELDALAKLPEPEREELVERAAAGEDVTARPEVVEDPAPVVEAQAVAAAVRAVYAVGKDTIRTILTEALPAVVDKHLPPVTPHPFFRLPEASTPVAGGVEVAAPAPVDEALALLERAIGILAAERTEPNNAEEIDERLWRLSLDWRQLRRQWTATVAIDTSGSE